MLAPQHTLIIGSKNGLGLVLADRKRINHPSSNITFLLHPGDPWADILKEEGYTVELGDLMDISQLDDAISTNTSIIHVGSIIYLDPGLAVDLYQYNVLGLRNVVNMARSNRADSLTFLGSIFGIEPLAESNLPIHSILHQSHVEIYRAEQEGLATRLLLLGPVIEPQILPSHNKGSGKILSITRDNMIQAILANEKVVHTSCAWSDLEGHIFESDIQIKSPNGLIQKLSNKLSKKGYVRKREIFFKTDFQRDTYGELTA